MTTPARVLIVGAVDRMASVQSLLEGPGVLIDVADYSGPAEETLASHRLAIVDACDQAAAARFAARWRTAQANGWRPLLWLADDPESRAAGWRFGASACLSRPFGIGELSAQVLALLALREDHERLAAWANESSRLNRTLARHYEQLDSDIRLARIVRSRCAGAPLAEVGAIRFAIAQRGSAASSRDFCSIQAIDAHRAAIALGDVMGQSLSANLLASYVQQIVAANRNLAPSEALTNGNRELLKLALAEPPLVRLTCATVHGATGEITYATAGHTAPLLLRKSGARQFQPATGSMLGLTESSFVANSVRLTAGDRLLLFTDGLIGAHADGQAAFARIVESHRTLPLSAQLETVAQHFLRENSDADDFTLVGVEFDERQR